MEDELKANLVRVATVYAEASHLALSTVALRSAKDARFLDRLNDGKSFTVRTYDTVMRWFSERWPENTPWPDHITRPSADPGEAAA